MNKTRIRTKLELSDRKKIFFKIINILEKQKIFFFIQGGLLLGARREKNFIRWDWDVEISVFASDLLKKIDYIIKILQEKNFVIKKINRTTFTPKIEFIMPGHKATSFSIIGWKYNFFKKAYTRRKLNIPSKFMKKKTKINFLKKKFYCPNPIDEYLEYQYGNWKKPIRSSDKKKYLTKNFYTQNSYAFFDIFMNFLINLKKRII